MKTRNYEKRKMISLGIIICFILELIFIFYILTNKISFFHVFSSIVVKDNLSLVVMSKKDREHLLNNSNLYINTHKVKYKIVEDKGVIIKKNNEDYYEMLIEFKFDKKYKANDTIEISIKKENKRIIEMFKLIWDGD